MLEPDLTNEQLQGLADEIATNWLDVTYTGTISFNRRLRTTGGFYFKADDHIQINPKLQEHGYETLIETVKHELCHYKIYHRDPTLSDHGKQFNELLQHVGGSRTVPLPKHMTMYRYRCQDCGTIYYRMRRVNTDEYACPCGGELTLLEKVHQ